MSPDPGTNSLTGTLFGVGIFTRQGAKTVKGYILF
jgi:hypothetical protein